MARQVLVLLAFLAVFAHAVAVAAFPQAVAEEIGHALVHAEERQHHHHDDGLLHMDKSQGSDFHVHLSEGAGVALVGSPVRKLPALAPPGPRQQVRLSLPAPWLEGLLRPPRPIG